MATKPKSGVPASFYVDKEVKDKPEIKFMNGNDLKKGDLIKTSGGHLGFISEILSTSFKIHYFKLGKKKDGMTEILKKDKEYEFEILGNMGIVDNAIKISVI